MRTIANKKWTSVLCMVLIFVLTLSCIPVNALAAGGYDPNKDYSEALANPNLSSSERKQLEQERQNKIDGEYGGKEPPLAGSTNGTKFTDVYDKNTGTVDWDKANSNTSNGSQWHTDSTHSDDYGNSDPRANKLKETLDKAVADGTITRAQANNAMMKFKAADQGSGIVDQNDPSVGVLLDAMGMEDNFVNRYEASRVLSSSNGYYDTNGTSSSIVNRYGEPIIYEGGQAYVKKDGVWVKDPSSPSLPNATDLSQDDLNKLWELRDQWDKAEGNGPEQDRIHEEAQKIRDKNGYDGGFDGNFYDPDHGGQSGTGTGPVPPPPHEDKYYKIISSAGEGGKITPSGISKVKQGSSQSYGITCDEGYHIENLMVDNVHVKAKDNYIFNNVNRDHTISVTFAKGPVPPPPDIVLPVSYTITATAGKGGTITPSGSVSVEEHSNAGFVATPNPNYEVESISVDGQIIEAQSSYTFRDVVADHTIHVTFKKTDVPPPPPPEVDKIYVITASVEGGGTITPAGEIIVKEHDDRGFVARADRGIHGFLFWRWAWTFSHFTVDGNRVSGSETSYYFRDVAADHTIVAHFVKSYDKLHREPYKITATAGQGGTITPSNTAFVSEGANSETYVMVPDDGYLIDEVIVDTVPITISSETYAQYQFVNVNHDHSIHVTFKSKPVPPPPPKEKEFKIIAVAGPGGTVNPDYEVTTTAGGSVHIFADPQKDYKVDVDNVQVNGVKVNYNNGPVKFNADKSTFEFENIQGNYTLYVPFALIDKEEVPVFHNIHSEAGEHGSISPEGDIVVQHGGRVSFDAYPDDEYIVARIIIDGTEIPDTGNKTHYEFENVTEDHTIRVEFTKWITPGKIVINATAGDGGTISPEGIVPVERGSSSQFVATPEPGYKFLQFIVDNRIVKTENGIYTFQNVIENHQIKAEFRPISSIDDIEVEFGGPGFGNVTNDGTTPSTKSGYGINCSIVVKTTACTPTKVIVTNTATNHIFELILVNGKWIFPVNPSSKTNARVDYNPAETRDGSYKFVIEVTAEDDYDGSLLNANTDAGYEIKGSMYEDDFTGDRQ